MKSAMFLSPKGIGSEFDLPPFHLMPPKNSKKRDVFPIGRKIWLDSGRSAINLAINLAIRATLKKGCPCPTFLLPAYLCPSVLQPFRNLNVPIEFYNIDSDLTIDIDDLTNKCGIKNTVVFFIHYFGFLQPPHIVDQLNRLSASSVLIEDLSHGWLSEKSAPSRLTNDTNRIKVYSLRKYLPVPEGGLAIFIGSGGNVNLGSVDISYMAQRATGLFLRWVFFQSRLTVAKKLAFRFLHVAEKRLDNKSTIHASSQISQNVLRNFNLSVIKKNRRDNFNALLRGISDRSELIKPLYGALPKGVVPLGFPIKCEQRNNLRLFLQNKGVFSPVHWTLPEALPHKRFAHLKKLSHCILTLPLDQRYTIKNMQYILDCLTQWERGL